VEAGGPTRAPAEEAEEQQETDAAETGPTAEDENELEQAAGRVEQSAVVDTTLDLKTHVNLPTGQKDYRAILVALYTEKNPKQLLKVEEMLTLYQGQEHRLIETLAKRYPTFFARAEYAAIFRGNGQDRGGARGDAAVEAEVERAAEQVEEPPHAAGAGAAAHPPPVQAQQQQQEGEKEEEKEEKEQEQEGSRQHQDSGSLLERLTAFYRVHNPSKLPVQEASLKNFVENEGALNKHLSVLYGVTLETFQREARGKESQPAEPAQGSAGDPDRLRQEAHLEGRKGKVRPRAEHQEKEMTPAMRHRERLVRFYTTHNPSKLAQLDQTLAVYRGHEDQLWAHLEMRYGAPVREV
jgi:hypothetical protein